MAGSQYILFLVGSVYLIRMSGTMMRKCILQPTQVIFQISSFQEWISILSAKSEFFKAIAEYHMARVAKDKAAYGEGVTRFKVG